MDRGTDIASIMGCCCGSRLLDCVWLVHLDAPDQVRTFLDRAVTDIFRDRDRCWGFAALQNDSRVVGTCQPFLVTVEVAIVSR